ncbi:MAG: hypothetical protein Q4G42_04100 [Neisseria sp.]|nr:hypothetical protein [Neisseria sp.]
MRLVLKVEKIDCTNITRKANSKKRILSHRLRYNLCCLGSDSITACAVMASA